MISVFLGGIRLRVRKLFIDDNFEIRLIDNEFSAWKSFVSVEKDFFWKAKRRKHLAFSWRHFSKLEKFAI